MNAVAVESSLKVELAKLQVEIQSLEGDVQQLQSTYDRADVLLDSQKTRAINDAKSVFATKQQQDVKKVEQACADMHSRAEALLDTFPGLKAKEYAGKYEIKTLEAKVAEVYPKALLESYVCPDPIEFDDEAEAYAVYTYVERKVAGLKQGSLVAAMFTGLTGLMSSVCKDDGASGKLALIVLGAIALSFIFSPFLFLTIFTIVGVVSAVQGALVHRILRDLYSVKAFLNETYDEDIFQQDKQDILNEVDAFLASVREDYVNKIMSRQFVMNESVLLDLEKQAVAVKDKAKATLEGKRQLLEIKRNEASKKLAELDALKAQREVEAKAARKKYLETIDWKYEWPNSILLDVTGDLRVVGTNWTQANSLYYSKTLSQLQQFWQLAIYQTMLRMPPDYCGQVVLDYKYMGSNLMQFSKVSQSLLNICVDQDAIGNKIERMQEDLQGRVGNILRSCESIEQFNEMMKSYGSAGEAYVIVHICGLKSIDETLKMFLRNGPKVGYFFKIYATLEEMAEWGKDLPFEEFKEYCEVGDVVTPRTSSTVRRTIEEKAGA